MIITAAITRITNGRICVLSPVCTAWLEVVRPDDALFSDWLVCALPDVPLLTAEFPLLFEEPELSDVEDAVLPELLPAFPVLLPVLPVLLPALPLPFAVPPELFPELPPGTDGAFVGTAVGVGVV